jgi:hypothetical protein
VKKYKILMGLSIRESLISEGEKPDSWVGKTLTPVPNYFEVNRLQEIIGRIAFTMPGAVRTDFP